MKRHDVFFMLLTIICIVSVAGVLGKKVFFSINEDNRPFFARDNIVFKKKDGATVSFDVEMALAPSQHAYGLMFKRSMPHGEGMLFVFETPQIASFWMKDTYIPLDMIFIRQDGVVSEIVQAEPLDLTSIQSKEPVSYVLEINEGEAQSRGLGVGDRLMVKDFSR